MLDVCKVLNYASENSKNHGHKTYIITFDQSLYMKAREMVADSEFNTELSKVIVRLEGFHMLMSFLGCIGYVMAESGIKEALSVIYARNSVDKMPMDMHMLDRLEVIHYSV